MTTTPALPAADTASESVGVAPAPSMVEPALPPPSPLVAPSSRPPTQSLALPPQEASDHAPFVELGAMDSHPGELVNDFLVRVAQAMDAFTRRTHHEVCGVIMRHETMNAWRVRLTTNRSHLACTMVLFDEPGFVRWGPDIHSHPRVPGGVPVNSQDVFRNPAFECGQVVVVFDERFSERDLDRGPGYLVSRGRLLFQKGREFPFRQLAVFDSLEEVPDLALGDSLALGEAVAQAAADAAWLNEDAPGIAVDHYPHTHCPPEVEDMPSDATSPAVFEAPSALVDQTA